MFLPSFQQKKGYKAKKPVTAVIELNSHNFDDIALNPNKNVLASYLYNLFIHM